MRNKMKSALVLVIVILMVTTSAVFADTGTVTLTGGGLTLTSKNVPFGTLTLNGASQTATFFDATNGKWNVTDATGNGAGWHVTVAATDFLNGSHTIPVSNFTTKLENTQISTPAITSSVTGHTALSATPLTILTAGAGSVGMGVFDFTPEFRLTIPADTYAGTYTSTITATVIAGP